MQNNPDSIFLVEADADFPGGRADFLSAGRSVSGLFTIDRSARSTKLRISQGTQSHRDRTRPGECMPPGVFRNGWIYCCHAGKILVGDGGGEAAECLEDGVAIR